MLYFASPALTPVADSHVAELRAELSQARAENADLLLRAEKAERLSAQLSTPMAMEANPLGDASPVPEPHVRLWFEEV